MFLKLSRYWDFMLEKVYEYFDNTLLFGANKINHAWNWTTGRTKSDLASLSYGGGAVLLNTVFAMSHPIMLSIGIPAFTAGFFSNSREFKKVEQKEREALENEAKDWYVEDKKRSYQGAGGFWGTLSIAGAPLDSLYSLGNASIGGSFYFMRTDYLPPRKNCLRRGVEKIAKAFKKSPSPQPALLSPNCLFQ